MMRRSVSIVASARLLVMAESPEDFLWKVVFAGAGGLANETDGLRYGDCRSFDTRRKTPCPLSSNVMETSG